MAKTGIQVKSKKEQALDAELGLIIDEMGRAMWNANKEYIAQQRISIVGLTLHMREVLHKYQWFCEEHYGK